MKRKTAVLLILSIIIFSSIVYYSVHLRKSKIDKINDLQITYLNSSILDNCTVVSKQFYVNGVWNNTKYDDVTFMIFDLVEIYRITGRVEFLSQAQQLFDCYVKSQRMDDSSFNISSLKKQMLDFYEETEPSYYDVHTRIDYDSVVGSGILYLLPYSKFANISAPQPFMQKIAEHLLSNTDITTNASEYDFFAKRGYVHLKILQTRFLIYYYDLTENTTFLKAANDILDNLFPFYFHNSTLPYTTSKYLRAICEIKQRDASFGQHFDTTKETVLQYQHTDGGFKESLVNDFASPYMTYQAVMALDACYQFSGDATIKTRLISALKYLLKNIDQENGGIVTYDYNKILRLNADITPILMKYRSELNE